ncbi:MAG: 3-keto-disaccharide hydrolase [Aureliella sp.]
MRALLGLGLLGLLVCSSSTVFADDPQQAPAESGQMRQLFNGKDLSGWDGDSRLWSVKDGVIHGETTAENPAKGNTFLIWQEGKLKDFELRLSFRLNATNNSGIQYRSKHITEDNVRNKWVVRGYQHELRNEVDLPNVSGFIYDEGGKRGRICLVGEKTTWETDGKKVLSKDLIDQDAFKKLFKLDDWNDVVIIAKGNHIQHYLNGRLILDFTDNDPSLALSEGVLAVQLHAGKPMWAEFKNIRLKEIK